MRKIDSCHRNAAVSLPCIATLFAQGEVRVALRLFRADPRRNQEESPLETTYSMR